MDIVKPNTVWHVKKAIYGLRKAPRLWQQERDQKLRDLEFTYQDKLAHLVQSYMHPSLWLIAEGPKESTSAIPPFDHCLRSDEWTAATSRAASLITHDPDTCCIRVKHICQYLHHTLSYVLRYVPIPPQSKQKLWVLGDASFSPTREKSQQGIVVYHGITSNQRKGGNLVQWRSGRQDLIAKSTCEAEFIASSEALQQGENISIVISEMLNASCGIEVSSDNAAALHMVRMDQRQHAELVTSVSRHYGYIKCRGEGSSSPTNPPLKWQLIV